MLKNKKESTQSLFMLINTFIILLLMVISFYFLLNCSANRERQFANAEQAEIAHREELKALTRGREIWFDPDTGTNGRSCESCHPKGEMTRAKSYPRYKHILRTMATLSMTHNFAVVNESKGKPWELGSYDANALVLYVMSLANGKPIQMAWPQKYRDEWINRGRIAFADTNFGNNSQSCESCHLKGGKKKNFVNSKVIPNLKGIAATYPKYSIEQGKVITLEQQVNYCLENYLDGLPLPLDDVTIVAFCCYLTSLSEGKKIAVARLN